MSEKPEKVKVQRNRKRIYETSPEDTTLSDWPLDVAALTSEAEAEVGAEPASPAVVAPSVMKPKARSTEALFHDAMLLVRTYSAWGAGAGLVPIPVVDVVAMTAVQMAMLKKLAALYDIPFSEQCSKSAVAALIGGLNAGYLGGSALKMFPVFGVLSL
ncbi:MAG: DUF697 domain-containing protein, partial [Pelobacteraceae bacterium]